MKKRLHIEHFGYAICDNLNNFDLVYKINKSTCPSCIIKIYEFYGHINRIDKNIIDDDIQKELKAMEIRIKKEEYDKDFEKLLNGFS